MRNTEIINKLIDMKDSRYILEDAISFVNTNCNDVNIYSFSEFEEEIHYAIRQHDFVLARAYCDFILSFEYSKHPFIGELLDNRIPVAERCFVIRNINDIIELIQKA